MQYLQTRRDICGRDVAKIFEMSSLLSRHSNSDNLRFDSQINGGTCVSVIDAVRVIVHYLVNYFIQTNSGGMCLLKYCDL